MREWIELPETVNNINERIEAGYVKANTGCIKNEHFFPGEIF
jgi:hypothetical protein